MNEKKEYKRVDLDDNDDEGEQGTPGGDARWTQSNEAKQFKTTRIDRRGSSVSHVRDEARDSLGELQRRKDCGAISSIEEKRRSRELGGHSR